MPKARQKVRPNEAIARATNAEPWQPEPGMVRKQCSRCRYFFAVPAVAAEVVSCPDCAMAVRPLRVRNLQQCSESKPAAKLATDARASEVPPCR